MASKCNAKGILWDVIMEVQYTYQILALVQNISPKLHFRSAKCTRVRDFLKSKHHYHTHRGLEIQCHNLVSGFNPFWKLLASWDDHSMSCAKIKHVPNHQPATFWVSKNPRKTRFWHALLRSSSRDFESLPQLHKSIYKLQEIYIQTVYPLVNPRSY